MSYGDKVWAHLQKYGSITAKGVEDITGTTCPHSVIRDIRKKYGEDVLDFIDRVRKVKVIENGKERIQSKPYRTWFLKKMEGALNA